MAHIDTIRYAIPYGIDRYISLLSALRLNSHIRGSSNIQPNPKRWSIKNR